ncbi:LolA family protein [Arundinibacter roseus]|uniref:Outer membrane lipoprotein carrier protein LolA n=1 Tax=Arundinibacter roseus TaxID=2070510 RepID=A0A4R4K0P2_9BACT|nr:outer membrane lipoprotein carrier protein LolA [Arundinibacter roseus]TDB60052.1 outer membrane lipoprotein carrier protein LolA [Arundinibacter roseus]
MKNKFRIFLTLLAGLSLSVYTPAAAQNDKRAASILDAMSNKYKSMTSFKAVFTYSPEGGRDMKGDATVKGTKFRLKMAGQEIFNDGKTMATYIKETNEVNLQDFDPNEVGDLNPTRIYTAYKKGYKYAFIKENTEGGQVYEVVELSPTSASSQVSKVEIKVHKKDKSIKSWKITQKNGQRVTYRVDQFQPNVQVADSFFAFNSKQYPGVEVVDLR